jgi:hypothetical protein
MAATKNRTIRIAALFIRLRSTGTPLMAASEC